jgi:hypothetical protein
MPLIATEGQRLSAVIAHEYEPATGFCREKVNVTVVTGMKIGAVLDASGALVTVANTANAAYVLIDESVSERANGVHALLVLARGPVILKDSGLSYAADVDTAPEKANVNAILKTKGLIVEAAI